MNNGNRSSGNNSGDNDDGDYEPEDVGTFETQINMRIFFCFLTAITTSFTKNKVTFFSFVFVI